MWIYKDSDWPNFRWDTQKLASYAKMAKCSTDKALRDIQDLKLRGIFIQNPGAGRSTSYRLLTEVEMQKFSTRNSGS
jgi:hypothetical protein